LGAAIGAITFSGSVIAFGKFSGKYKFRLVSGRTGGVQRTAYAQSGARHCGGGADRELHLHANRSPAFMP
jgi:hypothetical protein